MIERERENCDGQETRRLTTVLFSFIIYYLIFWCPCFVQSIDSPRGHSHASTIYYLLWSNRWIFQSLARISIVRPTKTSEWVIVSLLSSSMMMMICSLTQMFLFMVKSNVDSHRRTNLVRRQTICSIIDGPVESNTLSSWNIRMHEKRTHQVFYINREHRLTVSVMKTTPFVIGKSQRAPTRRSECLT